MPLRPEDELQTSFLNLTMVNSDKTEKEVFKASASQGADTDSKRYQKDRVSNPYFFSFIVVELASLLRVLDGPDQPYIVVVDRFH